MKQWTLASFGEIIPKAGECHPCISGKYEGATFESVEKAKYLGMSTNSDFSWDFHVQRLFQNMYYHLPLLRRLHRIFHKERHLQVYISYIQLRLDYGITLCACNTQKNIDLVQKV